jgi:hypothetical protein
LTHRTILFSLCHSSLLIGHIISSPMPCRYGVLVPRLMHRPLLHMLAFVLSSINTSTLHRCTLDLKPHLLRTLSCLRKQLRTVVLSPETKK